jgi:hypothetical protein
MKELLLVLRMGGPSFFFLFFFFFSNFILPKGLDVGKLETRKFIFTNDGAIATNYWIDYQILLTIPFTVVLAGRNFFKLKLIKTYLRTIMLQERLSELAMISIENEYLVNLKYDDVIEN